MCLPPLAGRRLPVNRQRQQAGEPSGHADPEASPFSEREEVRRCPAGSDDTIGVKSRPQACA